jgi:ABC-type multidrug transport system fused ATPase/permease subunit
MASFTVMSAANYLPEYLRARVAAGLMFKMMNEQSKIDSCSGKGQKPEIGGKVSIKNCYFAYPNAPQHLVLNGLNIEALNGRNVGIVGPSGCGKSTIIQLLERYYDCLSGNLVSTYLLIRFIQIFSLWTTMTCENLTSNTSGTKSHWLVKNQLSSICRSDKTLRMVWKACQKSE